MTIGTLHFEQPQPAARKIIGVVLAVALLIIVLLIIIRLSTKPVPPGIVSKGGRIVLTQAKPGMKLQNNTPIVGTFRPSDGAALYYFVTTKDHKAIGAGNILPNEKTHFSRNLTLAAKGHEGQSGQLEVYLQDAKGKRLDSVVVPVEIR
jgi:hypothetical protein